MNTVEQLETAIRHLSPEELAAFRAWFAEFDAEVWDRQFEADVAAGRLDQLAEEALQDLCEGRCPEMPQAIHSAPLGKYAADKAADGHGEQKPACPVSEEPHEAPPFSAAERPRSAAAALQRLDPTERQSEAAVRCSAGFGTGAVGSRRPTTGRHRSPSRQSAEDNRVAAPSPASQRLFAGLLSACRFFVARSSR